MRCYRARRNEEAPRINRLARGLHPPALERLA